MSRVSHTPSDFHPEISRRTNPARDWALSAGHADECVAMLAAPDDSSEFLREMQIQDAIELASDALRNEMAEARRMVAHIKPNGCIISMHRSQSSSDSTGFRTSCIVGVMVERTYGILAQGSGATMLAAAKACLSDFAQTRLDAVA